MHNSSLLSDTVALKLMFDVVFGESADQLDALSAIHSDWDDSFIPPLVEYLRLSRRTSVQNAVIDLLHEKTNQSFGPDAFAWFSWLWTKDILYRPYYAEFKGRLYREIDPRFEAYFQNRSAQSAIRLDEILWGGVLQDGIPPLRNPKMITVAEADYLEDDNIVFGMVINGIARAYPKRILAWHEMFTDDFGAASVAGVYCTLCGTVIAYEMNHKDDHHMLGTSGFLYRSNKLMYDKTTQSLWNTVTGEPVVGPLVGHDITLSLYPVVTTTWDAWRSEYPETTVLSLETGHVRDYGTGVAYRQYFGTDELMFPVPHLDSRLKNKDDVFIIRSTDYALDPLAIHVDYLAANPVSMVTINDMSYVIITDASGAARAYEAGSHTFESRSDHYLLSVDGARWRIEENVLSMDDSHLDRVPAHRTFWFSWQSMFPDTRLIK